MGSAVSTGVAKDFESRGVSLSQLNVSDVEALVRDDEVLAKYAGEVRRTPVNGRERTLMPQARASRLDGAKLVSATARELALALKIPAGGAGEKRLGDVVDALAARTFAIQDENLLLTEDAGRCRSPSRRSASMRPKFDRRSRERLLASQSCAGPTHFGPPAVEADVEAVELPWTRRHATQRTTRAVSTDSAEACLMSESDRDPGSFAVASFYAGTDGSGVVASLMQHVVDDADGTDRGEFEDLFSKYGLFQGLERLDLRDRLFAMFDVDGDGKIFVDEMAELLMIFASGGVHQRMRVIFDLYDRDRSSTISRSELGKLLKAVATKTRDLIVAGLAWEANVAAFAGGTLSACEIDYTHLEGQTTVRMHEESARDDEAASTSKRKKPKQAAAPAPAPGEEMVRVQVSSSTIDVRLDVAKARLLMMFAEEDEAGGERLRFDAEILEALVENCISTNDADKDGQLSFEEFLGWVGNSHILDELLRHFSS